MSIDPNDYPRSDWYPGARSDWYAAGDRGAAQASDTEARPAGAPAAPGKKPRKKHTGMKIAAIAVCVLLLIVASVYAFSDSFGFRWTLRDADGTEHGFSVGDVLPTPGSLLPSPGGEKQPSTDDKRPGADDPDGYDEDYRDYFSRYYTETRTSGTPSSIARAETGGDFRIELESAEGLEPLTLQALYAECVDTVVGIKAKSAGQLGYYWGTGIVMREDGYILTNQHIIAGTVSAEVILPDGTEAPALLVGEDTLMDVAVLKIEASGLHAARFGDSAELSVGDSVVAIGNPLADSLSGTMTDGIISAIDRSVSTNGHPMTLLQTNAALNEGNSGGPLFNLYGQVVGITNMKMVNTYSDVTVEGIGFAIPSVTAKAVADQLIATGRYVRPGIGITVGQISKEDAAHYGLPGGLYISKVAENSDAAAQGVQPGDVLTHVNGVAVNKTDDVLAIRDALQIGDPMTLTIYRDGKTLEIVIHLDELNKLY